MTAQRRQLAKAAKWRPAAPAVVPAAPAVVPAALAVPPLKLVKAVQLGHRRLAALPAAPAPKAAQVVNRR
jgi:hypothetical protein